MIDEREATSPQFNSIQHYFTFFNVNMAANERFDSWLSSTNLWEYAERLKQNGFDDIDLLKQMGPEEMILLIGMEKKGHILKLKKCLMGLRLC